MDNNQPAPLKSAEEVLMELGMYPPYRDGETQNVMRIYASQFKPRYVTDEEIDAMFSDKHTTPRKVYIQREAARAMRDRIFNNAKPNETKL